MERCRHRRRCRPKLARRRVQHCSQIDAATFVYWPGVSLELQFQDKRGFNDAGVSENNPLKATAQRPCDQQAGSRSVMFRSSAALNDAWLPLRLFQKVGRPIVLP